MGDEIDLAQSDGLYDEIHRAHRLLTQLGVGESHSPLSDRIALLAQRGAVIHTITYILVAKLPPNLNPSLN